jgi:hypothetical protein
MTVFLFVAKLWLVWHVLFAGLALLRHTPARWWIACRAMRVRLWLFSRLWTGVVQPDGWVGYFWSEDTRRLYIALCPYLVVRLDLRRHDPRRAAERLWRGLEEAQRAQKLGDSELAAELETHVGAQLEIGTRGEAVVCECVDRLRLTGGRN